MSVRIHAPAGPLRLHLDPTGSHRALLDGGWWPRTTAPATELADLVLAIDRIGKPITRLVLSASGWADHPRRLSVAGRVVRLGFFTSQPDDLLTAFCGNGERVDLLVVPPDTPADVAGAAMLRAADPSNVRHAQDLVGDATRQLGDGRSEQVWETDGQPRSGDTGR
ncbi:MAG TPA: DUF5994 family protein [Mycobacterium sp.]|nr:DUF5994 family protein [Mycobacterium sp.]